MNFEVTPNTTDKRGWTVEIDGEKRIVGHVKITSPSYGTLTYGMRPEGYDGWSFREIKGGGAVTLPYAYTPEGELLVGLLLEGRANMGSEPVFCAIGGFVDPGETHKQAQVREAMEEAGLDTIEAEKLPGANTNPNRAFFVADASGGEGVHAYGLKIPFEWTEKDKEKGGYKLKDPEVSMPNLKKATSMRLLPWRDAVRISPDALARAAIAQLLTMVM